MRRLHEGRSRLITHFTEHRIIDAIDIGVVKLKGSSAIEVFLRLPEYELVAVFSTERAVAIANALISAKNEAESTNAAFTKGAI